MSPVIQFFGATGEVTGSCHLVEHEGQRILIDCGMIQGGRKDEARNADPFPFEPKSLDAVILSHAHIDHSGRLPLLYRQGYRGPIYTQRATTDLCSILLQDAASLMTRDVDIENKKRARKQLDLVEPLYSRDDAEAVMAQFESLDYRKPQTLLPGVTLTLHDAGHILGSAIVELELADEAETRKLVFSGDLGRSGMPVLRDPEVLPEADLVVMESTYGDRLHRGWDDTVEELREMFATALQHEGGNILIPAFAVGRTQEILYLFSRYYDEWDLGRWQIFLDSPMAISTTGVYAKNANLFDEESLAMWRDHQHENSLPNLRFVRSTDESMALNRITSGAIIIAGSGMCNGGRILHHFKHHIWRRSTQVLITGFQARGTLGRMLVDGADKIRLWGETIRVAAKVHTVGGLSAHADQAGLMNWYDHFKQRPRLALVHGEVEARQALAAALNERWAVQAMQPDLGDVLDI